MCVCFFINIIGFLSSFIFLTTGRNISLWVITMCIYSIIKIISSVNFSENNLRFPLSNNPLLCVDKTVFLTGGLGHIKLITGMHDLHRESHWLVHLKIIVMNYNAVEICGWNMVWLRKGWFFCISHFLNFKFPFPKTLRNCKGPWVGLKSLNVGLEICEN